MIVAVAAAEFNAERRATILEGRVADRSDRRHYVPRGARVGVAGAPGVG